MSDDKNEGIWISETERLPLRRDKGANLLSLLSTPLKLSELAVAVSLLCYVAGLVVTNLYLGSIGIVSFGILRARYLITGFLFALFLGIVLALLHGSLRVIRRNMDRSPATLIAKVLLYSVIWFVCLFFAAGLLDQLAGSTLAPPIGIPQISPALPWSTWLESAPVDLLTSTFYGASVLLIIVLVIVLLVFVAFLLANPKQRDGTRHPRREMVRQLLSLRTAGRLLSVVLFTYLVFLVLNTASSVMTFIRENKVVSGMSLTDAAFPLPSGAARYLVAAFAVYAVAAVFQMAAALRARSDTPKRDDLVPREASWVYLVATAIGLVVPLYALGVYPSIPQQIGGGSVLRVEVLVSSDELRDYFDNTLVDVFLIDRTSSSSFFLLDLRPISSWGKAKLVRNP